MLKFILLLTLLLSLQLNASERTICGLSDDRVLSYEMPYGRLNTSKGTPNCSATLISKTCMITAGHCASGFFSVDFNTPLSASNGKPVRAQEQDIYQIDRTTISSAYPKKDYAVFRVLKNSITGKYPGDIQGFLPVSFDMPKTGTILRITGYGVDSTEPTKNQAQQTHLGELTRFFWSKVTSKIFYKVDTMGGNSGSSVVDEVSGEIIGIHTNGGCNSQDYTTNYGTSIYSNKDLSAAIKSCLAAEAQSI